MSNTRDASNRLKQSVFNKTPSKTFADSYSHSETSLKDSAYNSDRTDSSYRAIKPILTTPTNSKTASIAVARECSQSTGNSIKSSVKRLFSPSSSNKSEPLILSTQSNISLHSNPGTSKQKQLMLAKHLIASSSVAGGRATATKSTNDSATFITIEKILETKPAAHSSYITTASISNSFEVSKSSTDSQLTNSSSISSSISNVDPKKDAKVSKKKLTTSMYTETGGHINKSISAMSNLSLQPTQQPAARPTASGTLKKHLNLLKSNSKKVLLGSSSANAANQTKNTLSTLNKQQVGKLNASKKSNMSSVSSNSSVAQSASNMNTSADTISSSPVSINSRSSFNTSDTKDAKQHYSLTSKLNEYENRIKLLNNEINSSQRQSSESQSRVKELQMEIERLSRLYDYEISKHSSYEEKMISLKQLAEEKQIESAALKYEYRKVQELKESLLVENNCLKSFLSSINLNPANQANKMGANVGSRHSSPSSNQALNNSQSTHSPGLKNCKWPLVFSMYCIYKFKSITDINIYIYMLKFTYNHMFPTSNLELMKIIMT